MSVSVVCMSSLLICLHVCFICGFVCQNVVVNLYIHLVLCLCACVCFFLCPFLPPYLPSYLPVGLSVSGVAYVLYLYSNCPSVCPSHVSLLLSISRRRSQAGPRDLPQALEIYHSEPKRNCNPLALVWCWVPLSSLHRRPAAVTGADGWLKSEEHGAPVATAADLVSVSSCCACCFSFS